MFTLQGFALECTTLHDVLKRVEFPLSSTHYDTAHAMNVLLGQNHLASLFDRVFGNFIPDNLADTWISKANVDPDGPDAQALFELLSPSGHLSRVLQAMSPVVPEFHARLKHWHSAEEDDVVLGDGSPYSDTVFDMPLPILFNQHNRIERSSELGQQAPEKVPAVMLLPVWYPPVVTRTVQLPDHDEGMPCLRCAPYPFFLLRLVHYLIPTATESITVAQLEPPYARDLQQKIDDAFSQWGRTLWGAFTGRRLAACKDRWPFYERIVHAYLQYHTRVPVPRQLSVQHGSEDAIFSALFLHAPCVLWNRFTPCDSEATRQPITDGPPLSLLLCSLPFVCAFIEALPHTERSEPTGGSRQVASEVFLPEVGLRRLSLMALHQTLVSLSFVPRLTSRHVDGIVCLWSAVAALSTHREGTLQRRRVAFFESYDAVSVLLQRMLASAATCDWVSQMTPTAVKALTTTIEDLRLDPHWGWAEESSQAVVRWKAERKASPVMEFIRLGQVLCWDQASYRVGAIVAEPIFGESLVNALRSFADSIEERGGAGLPEGEPRPSDSDKNALRAALLSWLTPAQRVAKPSGVQRPAADAAFHRRHEEVMAAADDSGFLTPRGRDHYLRGVAAQCPVADAHFRPVVCIPTDHVAFVGRLSRWADMHLRTILTKVAVARGDIPVCAACEAPLSLVTRGRPLTSTGAEAVWECTRCPALSDRRLPPGIDGCPLVVDTANDQPQLCHMCRLVLPAPEPRGCRRLFSPTSRCWYCARCAVQPWYLRVSVANLARSEFWALGLGLLLVMTLLTSWC